VADVAGIPLPALRADLEQVRAAWQRGELEFTDSWDLLVRIAIALGSTLVLFAAASIFLIRRWIRGRKAV
jgi:hypothetical protein